MHALYDIFIRVIADGLVVPVVVIGAWIILSSPKTLRWSRVKKAFFAGMLALVISLVARLLYQDPRPFAQIGTAPKAFYLIGAGFPSLHALLVFTVTFIVWATTKNVKWSLLLLVLSILVAIGRVVALVHTPLDILGGVACAFLAVLIIYGKTIFTPTLRE